MTLAATALAVAALTTLVIVAHLAPGSEASPALLAALARGHVFCVVILGGASATFGAYVAMDIRRNGWPRLSWRA